MPAPLVLVAAAMAVPSGFYRPLVESFQARGWEARALPTRGFERGEPPASRDHDWGYADQISTIAEAVDTARAEQPDRPVVVLGHSLGAQLAVGHDLAHTPSDGLVLVGASVPHFRSYPYGGVPVLLMGVSVPVVTRLRGFLPKPFFGAPGARTLMREWARFVRNGRPPFAVPHRVGTPALVVQLQGDAYAVSRSSKVFSETFLEPASTTRWVYTRDAAPTGGSTDHLRWVKTPDVVVDRVIDWFAATR